MMRDSKIIGRRTRRPSPEAYQRRAGSEAGSEAEADWNEHVTLEIGPHPELSDTQRRVIALDGSCRRALHGAAPQRPRHDHHPARRRLVVLASGALRHFHTEVEAIAAGEARGQGETHARDVSRGQSQEFRQATRQDPRHESRRRLPVVPRRSASRSRTSSERTSFVGCGSSAATPPTARSARHATRSRSTPSTPPAPRSWRR